MNLKQAMKTDNLKADAATRATQIAAGEIKSKFLADGHKLRDWLTSEHGSEIPAMANDPRILERAMAEVSAWRRTKLLSGAQSRRR